MSSDLLDRLSNLQFSDVERAVSDIVAAIHAPNYFASTKKGETQELRRDLNSEYRNIRKETVKRVIAHMTIGKDVSSLFPDVLKNMQTEDLELKKLVYLYLMNYAKSHPDLVILAVNTFVKDTDDSNPLIRALAVRTMGCIRVDKMLDFIGDPLSKCLRDTNPYVRKTAAIGVAKLYDLSPELAVDRGFVQILQDMVSDANPMVVANAVSALLDINDACGEDPVFKITPEVLNKLLVALNECTEWGQISMLTAITEYEPTSQEEIESIVERVLPRLQHANGSVVLAAIKVLLLCRDRLENEDMSAQIIKKMHPPLVTLLSSVPEMQYVALRNISLILQRVPDVLSSEVRVFFCRYTDPSYVKLEKLDIMVKLCTEKNVDQLLAELKEYANEVDVDFVRRSVRAIGQCAIKVEGAAEKCVAALVDLLRTGVDYVVQESVIVLRDILRRYPDERFTSVLSVLCEQQEALDEPDAKASLIWMVGEYADRVGGTEASTILKGYLDTFEEEVTSVQLQIVSAIVKLFLRKPDSAQDLVLDALKMATQKCDHPDVRDRAYIYWRLLSTNPQAANAVVLSEKPPIRMEDNSVGPGLLQILLRDLGSVASVHHRPPQAFLGSGRIGADAVPKASVTIPSTAEEAQEAAVKQVERNQIADLLDLDFGEENASAPVSTGGMGGLESMSHPSGSAPSQSSQMGGMGGSSHPTNANALIDLVQSNVASAGSDPGSQGHGASSLMDLMGSDTTGSSPYASSLSPSPATAASPPGSSSSGTGTKVGAGGGVTGGKMDDLLGLFGDSSSSPMPSATPPPNPPTSSGSGSGTAQKDPFEGLF